MFFKRYSKSSLSPALLLKLQYSACYQLNQQWEHQNTSLLTSARKKSPFFCTRGEKRKKKKSIFYLLLFLSKRMREDNGIISRWFSNCIMCSLEGLTLFGSKTYVLHILIGPIKLATLHDPLLPECWLCACLSSLRKWNKNKHVYNNFQNQVAQIRTHRFIYIWYIYMVLCLRTTCMQASHPSPL